MTGHAVLTLQGLEIGLDDRMGEFVSGYATSDNRTRIAVDYGAHLSIPLTAGASKLNGAIVGALAKYDRVTVLAHSRGAETAGEWLDSFGRRPDAPDPARLDFILLGNPRRRLGGDGLGRRTPDDTAYRVRDIARANDGWANADDWPAKRISLGRAIALAYGKWFGDHKRYEPVRLDTCQLRERRGNTEYLVAP